MRAGHCVLCDVFVLCVMKPSLGGNGGFMVFADDGGDEANRNAG